MATGKDDAVVTDAFFSVTSGGGAESRIKAGSAFFVNVEVEAGTNAIASGNAYNLLVLLQNITTFTNDVIVSFSGNLGPTAGAGVLFSHTFPVTVSPAPAWNTPNTDTPFGFSVPVPGVAAGTIYRILAIVALGITETDVQTFESGLTLVQ